MYVHSSSCGFKHQHSDQREVEVEVVVGGGGEAAAECSLLTHDALPAPEAEPLLHLVLDQPGDLAVHPGPPHVARHLHGALGDGDDQQRVILRGDKVINIGTMCHQSLPDKRTPEARNQNPCQPQCGAVNAF